jgi:hypothetical protein
MIGPWVILAPASGTSFTMRTAAPPSPESTCGAAFCAERKETP